MPRALAVMVIVVTMKWTGVGRPCHSWKGLADRHPSPPALKAQAALRTGRHPFHVCRWQSPRVSQAFSWTSDF